MRLLLYFFCCLCYCWWLLVSSTSWNTFSTLIYGIGTDGPQQQTIVFCIYI